MTYASDHLRGVAFLNEPHMAEMILYISRHPGCGKTAVYRDVSRGDLIPRRLDMLVELGLLTIEEPRYNRAVLTLTYKGKRVARMLEEISEEIDGLT